MRCPGTRHGRGAGRRRAAAAAFILAALSAATPACVSARPSKSVITPPQSLQSTVRFQKEYLLAPEDTVDVVVQRAPEVSRGVMVRPDGFVSLPLLGDVQAEGLSVRELNAKLTALFSKRLLDPEVTVIATRTRQPVVYVLGEVTNPSAVPLRDAPTAMQAIALAGGFRRSAAARDIVIIRLAADGRLEALQVSMPVHGQAGGLMSLRMAPLRADDLVFVPENGRSQLARFLDDFLVRPLGAVNGIIATWVNYRLIQRLDRALGP